jgi:hypothetical protein
MQKLLVGSALAVAALVVAPQVEAQSRSVEFGGAAGVAFPTGDLGEGANTGFRIGGLAQFQPSGWPVGLRGEVNYTSLTGETIGTGAGRVELGSTNVLEATGNAIYNFNAPKDATTSFYVIGGAGIYNVNRGGDTNFGLNGGAGVNFNLGGFRAFAEARAHTIFSDSRGGTMIPLTFGIRF